MGSRDADVKLVLASVLVIAGVAVLAGLLGFAMGMRLLF